MVVKPSQIIFILFALMIVGVSQMNPHLEIGSQQKLESLIQQKERELLMLKEAQLDYSYRETLIKLAEMEGRIEKLEKKKRIELKKKDLQIKELRSNITSLMSIVDKLKKQQQILKIIGQYISKTGAKSGKSYDSNHWKLLNEAAYKYHSEQDNFLQNMQIKSQNVNETETTPDIKIQIGSARIENSQLTFGNGPRKEKIHVKFQTSFKHPPRVIASLGSIDSSHQANLRITVTAEDITREGFNLVFKAWANTTIHSASGSWIAIDY